MADKPRVLVLTGKESTSVEDFRSLAEGRELTLSPSLPQALALLQSQAFDGIFISAQDTSHWQQVQLLMQNEAILEVLGEGVAILQLDGRILWANATFEKWCGSPVQGQNFYEALGSPAILGPDFSPLSTVMQGTSVQTRLQRGDQFLELHLALENHCAAALAPKNRGQGRPREAASDDDDVDVHDPPSSFYFASMTRLSMCIKRPSSGPPT